MLESRGIIARGCGLREACSPARARATRVPFSTPNTPAISNALDASLGRCVSTTDAAMVSGASALSSSSGIRSSGELDMLKWGVRLKSLSLFSRVWRWLVRVVGALFLCQDKFAVHSRAYIVQVRGVRAGAGKRSRDPR